MLYLRLLAESVRFALSSLTNNKLRTSLSLLGITIGIFAIISVFTMVDSMEKKIRDSVTELGDNVVFIQKWPWEFGKDYPWWKYMQRPTASIAEMEQLKRRSKLVEAIAFQASTNRSVSRGSQVVENTSIVAASHGFKDVKHTEISVGRYFSAQESAAGRKVAIIGQNVADNLFGALEPLERSFSLSGIPFRVIGIFSYKGESMFGDSYDNTVLIPLSAGRTLMDISDESTNPFIMVQAREGVDKESLKLELTAHMRTIRRLSPREEDNFSLNEISLLSKGIQELFGVVNIAGWIIGLFSILVGGFGTANIMFVSVRERTSIIGIQKSLGARNNFILFQFLSEAIILCVIGGAAGLLMIFSGTLVLNAFADAEVYLQPGNIMMGISISVAIGLVAGIFPALSASRLDPVTAIRSN